MLPKITALNDFINNPNYKTTEKKQKQTKKGDGN